MKTTHERSPRDNGSRESLVADAVDDFRERCARGEQPDVAEHAARFPQVADELRRLLPALVALDAAGLDSEDGTPSAIGDFRIQREVGRGGMAVVYEAEQLSLGRRVALKVLPFAAVMDPRQLQRFKNEAQAAAHLHHGHIVPVHSVGCERGVHYYAMQYIEGLSVAQMIDELGVIAGRDMPAESSSAAVEAITRGKSTQSATYCRAVARLGIQAAEALDHAHQQGMVHRDIKPANLLVDASGHLWITDFGLASFTSQPGLTMTGDIVGTVRYMSPEQALAKRVPIDHRTDIYSLGVTLYELLTLKVAFSGDDPHRVIQEIAFTEPRSVRSLNAAVPDELETILIKAMAKDPGERFATAQDLAEDLQRYLAHKPIHARRPTLVQRAGKWARRHAALVWGVAAVLALTVAGLFTGAMLLWREQARTAKAYAALSREQAKTDKAYEDLSREQARTQQQRDRAEANLGLALEALDDVYLDEAEITPKLRPGLSRDLLEKGLGFYERFAEENGSNPAVCRKRGEALARAGLIYRRLGDQQAATRSLGAAVASLRGAIRLDPGDVLARVKLALALRHNDQVEEAIAVLREASRLDPTSAEVANSLGAILCDEEHEFGEAIAAFRRAIRLEPDSAKAYSNLGIALRHQGRLDEAIAAHLDAIRLRPDYANAHHSLGSALKDKGRLKEAIVAYREAVRLRPNRAVWHNDLAFALIARGEFDEAITNSRDAIRIQPDYAGAYNGLGASLCKAGRLDEGIAAFREGVRLHPAYFEVRLNLGIALRMAGQVDGAIAAFRDAIQLRAACAEAHQELGIALHMAGQVDGAIAACREAIRLRPDHPMGHAVLARCFVARGQMDEAIAAWREAVRIEPGDARLHYDIAVALDQMGRADEALATYRDVIRLQPEHAKAHCNIGNRLFDQGEVDQAIAAYREAIRLEPDLPQPRGNLANALSAKGQIEEAILAYREAIRIAPRVHLYGNLAWCLAICEDTQIGDPEEAVALAKKATRLEPSCAGWWCTLGIAKYRMEDLDGAMSALERSMALSDGGDAYDWLFLSMARSRQGEREEARAWYDRSLAWMKEHAPDDPDLKRFAAEAADLLESKAE